MQYATKTEGDTIFVTLTESFTFRDNASFRELLSEIDGQHFAKITCDVTGVDFVDSAALGMFLLLRDTAEKKHADVVLKGAQGQVKKMFEVSKFSQLFIVE